MTTTTNLMMRNKLEATIREKTIKLLGTGNARLKVNRPMGKEGAFIARLDCGNLHYCAAGETVQEALDNLEDQIKEVI